MAKFVLSMNQSLDGYVDHTGFAPGPMLFRHFIEEAQGQAGSIYGRRMYEIMRYWDDDQSEWGADERALDELQTLTGLTLPADYRALRGQFVVTYAASNASSEIRAETCCVPVDSIKAAGL